MDFRMTKHDNRQEQAMEKTEFKRQWEPKTEVERMWWDVSCVMVMLEQAFANDRNYEAAAVVGDVGDSLMTVLDRKYL